MAAQAGLVGFACANVTPLDGPHRGPAAHLRHQPPRLRLPRGHHDPLVFDMATSATAGFKVRLAALAGKTLPPGLILDRARPGHRPPRLPGRG